MKKKLGYTLRNAKLSFTCCREILRTLWHPKDYRLGGVTSVVSNELSHNVSERLFRLSGRWKSDETEHINVLEPQCSRLLVNT